MTLTPLAWPGLRNARDLGGLPTMDGGEVRHGAVVRADSPHALTADGIAALRAHGVTRIIDLRSADEAQLRPNVLAADPMYRLVPFTDPDDDPADQLSDLAGIDELYRCRIAGDATRITAAVAAVADAPPGAVLVHCQAGQDRTGMLAALLLRIAGVADDVIVEDYTFSSICWESPGECEPESIQAVLTLLDTRWGGAGAYLLAHGLSPSQLSTLRARSTISAMPASRNGA
ncbi:tyrosine-protein phosphatase [Dactylosporangium sp. NBC_01737]|uniref:tyrosine-protein phosphatase n=1 Tax=Dactylosporangium sp. NBC_01737 TaxID=2975959 RepID=UPI002E150E1F|nr:tyrosine-protein phosphatase [Dactylosporangium sp. NBC_01737]